MRKPDSTGIVAQWQSMGLQVLGSPVQFRSVPFFNYFHINKNIILFEGIPMKPINHKIIEAPKFLAHIYKQHRNGGCKISVKDHHRKMQIRQRDSRCHSVTSMLNLPSGQLSPKQKESNNSKTINNHIQRHKFTSTSLHESTLEKYKPGQYGPSMKESINNQRLKQCIEIIARKKELENEEAVEFLIRNQQHKNQSRLSFKPQRSSVSEFGYEKQLIEEQHHNKQKFYISPQSQAFGATNFYHKLKIRQKKLMKCKEKILRKSNERPSFSAQKQTIPQLLKSSLQRTQPDIFTNKTINLKIRDSILNQNKKLKTEQHQAKMQKKQKIDKGLSSPKMKIINYAQLHEALLLTKPRKKKDQSRALYLQHAINHRV